MRSYRITYRTTAGRTYRDAGIPAGQIRQTVTALMLRRDVVTVIVTDAAGADVTHSLGISGS